MTQILIAAGSAVTRQKLTAAVHGMDQPVVAVATRNDIAIMLDANARQVLVHWPGYGGDVGWVAETLEHYPGLRVVYISPTPWVSLSYSRARCMIAPPSVEMLDVGLLRRMVTEMLRIGADGNRAALPPGMGGHRTSAGVRRRLRLHPNARQT